MSDASERVGKEIQALIDESVRRHLTKTFEPVVVLKDFESVEVLTFDEVCKVFRLTETVLEKAINSKAVPCIKLGKPRSTWRFPKRLVVDYLLGNWNPGIPEKMRKRKSTYQSDNDIKEMVRKLRS